MADRDIEAAIAALQAVSLALDTFGSSQEGHELIEAACSALNRATTNTPQITIRHAVSEAIRRVYLLGAT